MTQIRRHDDTRKDLLKVEWDAPSSLQSGDSNILSYKLIWDAGTGTADQELTSVTTYYIETSYAITQGITTGQDYKFKVQALNIYGWGEASDVVTVRVSEVPAIPA